MLIVPTILGFDASGATGRMCSRLIPSANCPCGFVPRLRGVTVRVGGQLQQGGCGIEFLRYRRLGFAHDIRAEADILPHAHVRIQRVEL